LKNNQTKAYVFALSAIFLWSTVATAFKLSLRFINPNQLLLFASSTSLLLLFILVVITGKLFQLRHYSKATYVKLAILGLINPFLYYLVLFHAYELLPAQEAQPINYTWALTLSYLSVFILKQKLSRYDILAGLICYMGVLVITTHGELFAFSFSSLLGVFLALFSTVLWALYWLYTTKLHTDPLIGLFINFLVGVPAIIFYMLLTGASFTCNGYGLIGSIYVGFFEMGITFILWFQAMRYSANAAMIANLIFISPFLSLIFISFFLGEKILFSTFLGLVFIILGLLVQNKAKKRL